MNDWFRDPRAENGEAKSLAAERAVRHNDLARAHALYLEAAESFASVALVVPFDYPNTRGDLAVAAVACFGKAQKFERAVVIAQQFLVESDGISKDAHRELTQMAEDFVSMPSASSLLKGRLPTKPKPEPRARVRGAFRFQKDAA